MTHETNCSHHWIYIFLCLPHTLFSTSWAFAYRQSAAWKGRPNFYRNDRRPKLSTSGRTEDLKETRKHSVTYQHKGERRISSPVLWLWTKFHLPQTRNKYASVSPAGFNPSFFRPHCPLATGRISISTCIQTALYQHVKLPKLLLQFYKTC